MTLNQLKSFLWQCTKLNFFFLLFVFIVLLFSDQVYLIHQYFYGGTSIDFKKDLYLIMGLYKLMWVFFNLIPYYVVRTIEKQN